MTKCAYTVDLLRVMQRHDLPLRGAVKVLLQAGYDVSELVYDDARGHLSDVAEVLGLTQDVETYTDGLFLQAAAMPAEVIWRLKGLARERDAELSSLRLAVGALESQLTLVGIRG